MPKENTRAPQSQAGTGEKEAPSGRGPAGDMEATMTDMMEGCHCGPAMMRRVARFMGCCGPSKPGGPTPDTI